MRQQQLGNPTTKAWLAGWDAGVVGKRSNPYTRAPQAKAWERGRASGLRSSDDDVRVLKLMLAKKRT